MPPRKDPDPDFEIHVDPSCLSVPMDDETLATESISAESPEIPNEENVEQELAPEEPSTLEGSIVDDPDMDQEEAQAEDERESDNPATEEDEKALAEDEQEAVLAADDPAEDSVHEEYKEEAIEQAPVEEAQKERPRYYSDGEDEDTPLPTQIIDNDVNEAEQDADASRRQSGASERRTSLRTEALIQAAAREVVAKIEANARERYSMRYSEGADDSILSLSTHDTYAADGTEMTCDQSDTSGRQSHRSSGSRIHHHVAPHSISGDSSSHPEADDDDDDDDVFSDRSPRSSLGSMDGSNDAVLKPAPAEETKAARISRVSDISGLSQYDKEQDEFVPTSRDTPRIPFRTPSAVRAIQMSSPTPSVYSGATPRSSRRHHNHNPGLCTVSRLGSPNAAAAAAQYSPKGRPTPPRFKPKEAAPLVLLHVTLLPLRWAWGDVLDATGDDGDDGGKPGLGRKGAVGFQPSDELRRLRDSWRQLRDRVGDTVLERGVLLPHPQNDYEVLEERLLEALELPLRRRARILECGHYVGPADEMADDDDGDDDRDESEDEQGSRAGSALRGLADARKQRHWCGTCRGEIRFEDLGPGKVFRVKVYASNGLMRAGAWAACWKEMERVDVELEPIVETALLRELERLSAVREEEEERQREREQEEEEEHLQRELAQGQGGQEHLADEQLLPVRLSAELYHARRSPTTVSSPPLPTPMSIAAMRASPPEPLTASPVRAVRIRDPLSPAPAMVVATPPPPAARLPEPIDTSEARRHRDEERLREIYGRTPPRARFVDVGEEEAEEESPVRAEHATPHLDHDHHHPDSSYVAPSSPTSPSEEAFDRRSARHHEEQHQHQHHHPHHQYEHHQQSQNHHQQNQNYNNHNGRPYQTASLPELLLEAGRVLLRDRRNVAIALLSLFVLMLAVRPGPVPVAPVPAAAYLQHHHHRPAFGEEVRDRDVDVDVGMRGQQGREGEGAGVVVSGEVVHETPVEVEGEKVVVQVLETVTETVRVSVTVSTVVEAEATAKAEAEAGVEALESAVYEAEGETVVVTGSEAVVEVETEVVNVVETQVGTETETESEASIATASAPEEPVERAASESAEVDPAAVMADEGVEEKGNEE
ncbi:putative pathway-specific nitrogen regulator protein [Phialemonium atrogriseum]|uniref:Pathway-specific nitrogen regulator protein n=1 Tax=Phialemonium atrogriseum TaxID=1093897 RepID=A0AAJ0CCL6_9PEZI|nr:putative pathway-specific nitrogen regulator protein [Phialemonium atrogriseum]KAK1772792.1 putative pathway-specific nitrogen regulator protein [Phialemonium atrogriseum]